MQWFGSYAPRPGSPTSGSSAYSPAMGTAASSAPYCAPPERPNPPTRTSAYAPPLQRWASASAAASPSLPAHHQLRRYNTPHYRTDPSRVAVRTGYLPTAPPLRRWVSSHEAYTQVTSPHTARAGAGAAAAQATVPSSSSSSSMATAELNHSPHHPNDPRALPTPANGAADAAAPVASHWGGGSPVSSPATRALSSLPGHDAWATPASGRAHGGAGAGPAAWTFETPDRHARASAPLSAPPSMRLRLFDFAVVSLDGAAAAAATDSAAPLPLLLRGVVSGGSPLRFATEPAWPTAAQQQPRATCVTTCSVSWPSCVVEDTVQLLDDGAAAGTAAPPAVGPVSRRPHQDPLLRRTLVLECYAVAPPPSPPRPHVGEAAAAERYLGRCHVPLSDVVASAAGAGGGAASTEPSPRTVELTLRGSRGAAMGRVRFAAALHAAVYRTVRLDSLVVYPDPLEAVGGGVEDGGGELALALLPPGLHGEQAPIDDASVAAAVLVSADSRSATAVRWSALPPVSYPSTDEEHVDGSGESSGTPAVPPPPPLLRGCLYYCSYKGQAEVAGHGATGVRNGGSPHPPPPPPAPHRVLLGTFAVPLPAPPSARSARGRNGHSAGHAPASAHQFEAPLHLAGELAAANGAACWVRGVVETWTSTSLPATASWEGPQMGRNPESWTATGDRRRGSVPHPPPTPQPPAPAVRSAPASPAAGLTAAPPTPQEGAALQRVRARQEALIDRVEHRLAEVQERRRQLQAEMAAATAQAHQEENAIAEEYGLLESQLRDATRAYEAAASELAELRESRATSTAQHDAYAAEQERALAEVARERQEALELREQLEALRAQMASHLAAEQQRYAAQRARTQAAAEQAEHNSQWLTEVEAKVAAAAAAAAAEPFARA